MVRYGTSVTGVDTEQAQTHKHNSRQGSKPSKQIRKTTQAGWGELKGQSPGKQANGQTGRKQERWNA